MTSTEVFESVTNGGSTDFALVVRVLASYQPWCLIGGLAVNCYVEPVFTLDADIVVVSAKLKAIEAALRVAGFTVESFEHSLNANMPGSDLRILTLDDRYQAFVNRAEVHEVLGQQVPIASLSDVVQGKVWAWQDEKRRASKRKKDELDLMRILEAYPETRQMMPQRICEQVPDSNQKGF
jgi:hypothetical protein